MIVTEKSLHDMIRYEPDEDRVNQIVGRALLALFRRQTEDEKTSNDAKHTNKRGFNASDAKDGSITAKYFIKHGKLEDWMVSKWTNVDFHGRMRIVKYWRQLNEIAEEKRAAKNA